MRTLKTYLFELLMILVIVAICLGIFFQDSTGKVEANDPPYLIVKIDSNLYSITVRYGEYLQYEEFSNRYGQRTVSPRNIRVLEAGLQELVSKRKLRILDIKPVMSSAIIGSGATAPTSGFLVFVDEKK